MNNLQTPPGYTVGLDGGGTKTAASVLDGQGKEIFRTLAGAVNVNGETEERVRETISRIFSDLSSLPGGIESCRAVCIGAAGISNPKTVPILTDAVRRTGYAGPLFLLGDQETALAGALGRPDGVILIAGTGSICYGKKEDGTAFRAGGWGHLIDDGGSGYAIGRDILSAVVRAQDGRGPATQLSEKVFEALGASSLQEVIAFTYGRGTRKQEIAALAPLVTEAAGKGDGVALEICRKAAEELFLLAQTVQCRMGVSSGKLAMAGGILLKDPMIQALFLSRMKTRFPHISCQEPEHDAAWGAALLASQRAGRPVST